MALQKYLKIRCLRRVVAAGQASQKEVDHLMLISARAGQGPVPPPPPTTSPHFDASPTSHRPPACLPWTPPRPLDALPVHTRALLTGIF